jgi:hypothetical protein
MRYIYSLTVDVAILLALIGVSVLLAFAVHLVSDPLSQYKTKINMWPEQSTRVMQ